jgi:GxxExxY protein
MEFTATGAKDAKEKEEDRLSKLDLVVEGLVIIEIKSVDSLAAIHQAQVISYLRLSGKKLGLLINFNTLHLRDGIRRVVNGL